MFSFDTGYRAAQRACERRPRRVLAAAGILYLAAAAGLWHAELDLSFRPLFASGEEVALPTREFEQVFGQASGAWIAAVVERDGIALPDLLRTLDRLSTAAAGIPQVSEVLSLTSVRVPMWRAGALTFAAPLPALLLEPGEESELDAQYRELLDGSRFVGRLVSADGSRLLLAARLAMPLDDLDRRREAVYEFRNRLERGLPAGVRLHYGGVSVVELAYEKQVLRDQLLATALTVIALATLLLATLGNWRAVLVCLLPVMTTVPATLGLMGWLGQPVTIIHTVIPALILVIGVADAVHMLLAWQRARDAGAGPRSAVNSMLEVTGRACFYTTVTTVAGFLALESAALESVGSFGLTAALGILLAWLCNQLMLPWLLRRIAIGRVAPCGFAGRFADRAIDLSVRAATTRPKRVVAIAATAALAAGLALPALETDQRFNEELPATHPVSRAQGMLDRDFGGFLGPEISIRRVDGSSMLDDDGITRLDAFLGALRSLPQTTQVQSIRDLLPRPLADDGRGELLRALREHPQTRAQARELVNDAHDRLAVIVRTGDIGTRRAAEFRDRIGDLLETHWDAGYETHIVGQWWLAQHGMQLLLRDMLAGIATAMLLVLPLLWIAIRDRTLFLAAVAANLLPLLLPFAVMAAGGITLRIGTVVVLAVALGIVVDNTLHVALRIRDDSGCGDPGQRLRRALESSGRAVLFTTLALVGGFLSMLANELQAIRDMGIVAAVTFTGAMLADLVVLPAACRLLARPAGGTPAAAALSCRS